MSDRRNFLKGVVAASGAAVAATALPTPAEARETKQRPPEALGLLSHVVGSIREWRGEISRGMLPPWATR